MLPHCRSSRPTEPRPRTARTTAARISITAPAAPVSRAPSWRTRSSSARHLVRAVLRGDDRILHLRYGQRRRQHAVHRRQCRRQQQQVPGRDHAFGDGQPQRRHPQHRHRILSGRRRLRHVRRCSGPRRRPAANSERFAEHLYESDNRLAGRSRQRRPRRRQFIDLGRRQQQFLVFGVSFRNRQRVQGRDRHADPCPASVLRRHNGGWGSLAVRQRQHACRFAADAQHRRQRHSHLQESLGRPP